MEGAALGRPGPDGPRAYELPRRPAVPPADRCAGPAPPAGRRAVGPAGGRRPRAGRPPLPGTDRPRARGARRVLPLERRPLATVRASRRGATASAPTATPTWSSASRSCRRPTWAVSRWRRCRPRAGHRGQPGRGHPGVDGVLLAGHPLVSRRVLTVPWVGGRRAGHCRRGRMTQAGQSDAWTLPVDRSDLGQTRRLSTPVPDLAPGEALLRVEKVGLTANNVTYAVLGETFRYWEFFPTEPGRGRRPAVGVRGGRRVDGRRARDRGPCLRLPAVGQPSRGAPRPSGRARLPRDGRAPGDAPLAVQHLRAHDRRPGLRGRPRGPAGAVPPAVLDVVHAGRLADRPRRHGRRADRGLLGVEQDRLRRGLRAAPQGRHVVGLTLAAQRRLHREPRLLRHRAALRRGDPPFVRRVRRSTPTWPATRGWPTPCAPGSATRSCTTSSSASPTSGRRPPARSPRPGRRCSSRPTRCASASATGAGAGLDQRFADAWRTFAPVVQGWVDVVEKHGPDALEEVWHEVHAGRAHPRSGHVITL